MPTVAIRDAALWVDQQRIPFVAGELHYWRTSPHRHHEILQRCRQLGLNVIATYIPWQYHELAPGRFDFRGDTEPQRDLCGFLDRLAAENFWVFIRPGPFIYAEWTNAGVPDRVVTLPRLSDAYRREAAVWMAAVTDVIRPHLATRGGRIVLFQPDNEMDLFSHWFEGPCGLDGTAVGFYHDFLRDVYAGNLADLNAAWGTGYQRFEDVPAFSAVLDPLDPHARARHRDFWRFQHWATRTGIAWHVDEYRRLGIDVPMVANYYPGGDVQNWREVRKAVEHVGIDWYPRHEFAGDPRQHRNFLDSCRYQRALTPLPMIAEFECGVWHGYHDYVGTLLPAHYRLMACSALLAGIQGWNWYMFVARDNWYFCPVSERGETRPELAAVFRDIHRVFAACDPPTLAKRTDTCVAFEPVQIGTDNILADNPVLQALYDADVDFEVYDPELGHIARPLMFYASAGWLPADSQRRLVEYVESGGTLVLAQHAGVRDERFQPCAALGLVPPDRVLSRLGKKVELDLGGHTGLAEGHVWVWDNPPGTPLRGTQVAGRQQVVENADKWMTNYIGRQWTCGYVVQRGRGRLIVLGLPLSPDLVRAIHRFTGTPLYAQSQLPGVRTALFTRGDEHYLIATNLADADVHARVALDGLADADVRPRAAPDAATLPARLAVTDLFTEATEVQPADQLTIALPRRTGGVWRLTST
jgi:hypothetical protein